MEKRFLLFIALFFVIVAGYPLLMQKLGIGPQAPPVAKKPADAKKAEPPAAGKGKAEPPKPAQQAAEIKAPENDAVAQDPANKPISRAPLRYIPLGSLNPIAGTRMLATITTRGAAIARVELNAPRFSDQEDHAGYLGHLIPTDAEADGGARVQVVGPGTPAAAAGLRVGDVITSIGAQPIRHAVDLAPALARFSPGETAEVTILRDSAALTLKAKLIRRPLELIRPEHDTRPVEVLTADNHDPLSLLLTLTQIGTEQATAVKADLPGLGLMDQNWDVVSESNDHVELACPVPRGNLTVIKRYRLARVPDAEISNESYRAYHMIVEIEVRRDADEPIQVAYRLDGPNGLPTEGWWYMSKIGRTWGAAGARDVAAHFEGSPPELLNCLTVVEAKKERLRDASLGYAGVDTQYFSAVLLPEKPLPIRWNNRVDAVLVGAVPKESERHRLANVSCRITSEPVTISREAPLKHSYTLFAGPKERTLLQQYGPPKALDEINLSELIYYGWAIWGWFAKPLSHVLHFFARLGNYGLAIVLLTVMVRLCMFPLSLKQALGAQKMQLLQPEMKRIAEKYKKDLEKRSKALQELYKKHNYSPLSGCLPMFIQLPIFIGLYRALMIDINLRQAPLITESLGWCTNLAAPDMLWRWDSLLPQFLGGESGFLGPYLNVLPLLTVGLFIWQQKMFLPPPADEQAAMQQKIMQYMMVFMGFMFFKVPSGLCVYFIASSLWGIGERKLLPKAVHPTAEGDLSAAEKSGSTQQQSPSRGDGSSLTRSPAAEARAEKRRKRSRK